MRFCKLSAPVVAAFVVAAVLACDPTTTQSKRSRLVPDAAVTNPQNLVPDSSEDTAQPDASPDPLENCVYVQAKTSDLSQRLLYEQATRSAFIRGSLEPGLQAEVVEYVQGENVSGQTIWYLADLGNFEGWIAAANVDCLQQPPSSTLWVWPVPLTRSIVRDYDYYDPIAYACDGKHDGIDIGGEIGDPIVAVSGGTVVHVGQMWLDSPGSGRGPAAIIINHGEGIFSTYGHNDTAHVQVGQTVSAGQRIADIGAQGYAGGISHLHLEILENTAFTGQWNQPFIDSCNRYVDPKLYVNP